MICKKMISVKSAMRDWKNNDSADVIYYFKILHNVLSNSYTYSAIFIFPKN